MAESTSISRIERFLRDGKLENLAGNVRSILDRITEGDPPKTYLYHYVYSLFVSFKSKAIVLKRIEESIDVSRRNGRTSTIDTTLSKAASLIQNELIQLHQLLIHKTEPILKKE